MSSTFDATLLTFCPPGPEARTDRATMADGGTLTPGATSIASAMLLRVSRAVIIGSMQGRLVYSSGGGRICPGCGWPAADCRCSSKDEERVPERPLAKLRLEKKGRAGKTVTLIEGLPKNAAFVDALAQELKRTCGTGGTARDGSVELQGDHREKAASHLAAKGFTVKGATS